MNKRTALVAGVAIAAAALTGCGSSEKGADLTALLDRGVSQQEHGQVEAATATFTAVLAKDPSNKYAYYDLGIIAAARNDAATALYDYSKAIAADPSFTAALYNKALIVEAANPTTAEALYRQILAVNPRASTTHLHLAQLLLRQSRFDEAVAEYAAAVQDNASLLAAVPSALHDTVLRALAAATGHASTPAPAAKP